MGSLSTVKPVLILEGEILAKLRKALAESWGIQSTACLIYIEMEGARPVVCAHTVHRLSNSGGKEKEAPQRARSSTRYRY